MMLDVPRVRLPMAALAVIVVIAVVVSSAGCIVEEDEQTPDASKVPDDRGDARLVVDGAVQTALNWTLQQVVDLGLVDFRANTTTSVGGTLEGNFSGVRLATVLDAAKVSASADILEFEASDGYTAVAYRSDLGPDTFLAVKEEGEWSPLATSGAIRLVSTSLSSQQWVKLVVAVHAMTSPTLAVTGLVNRTGTISAGWVHSMGDVTVSWTEGTKTRTARGLSLDDVLDEVQADRRWGTQLTLTSPGSPDVLVDTVAAIAAGKDYLAADAKGRLVYVSDSVPLVGDLMGLHVEMGPDTYRVPEDRTDVRLVVDGTVQTPLNMSLQQVVDLGMVNFQAETTTGVGGTLMGNFTGVRVDTVILTAGVEVGADILEFEASDGYRAVVYRSDLGPDTFLAVKEEGEWNDLEDVGAIRLVSTSLGSQQWVRQVVAIHAKASQPLAVTGLANRTGTVTAGWVHTNGDLTVSWTEGTKGRSAAGMALEGLLGEVEADMWWGTTLVLTGSAGDPVTINVPEALAADKDRVAADAKGRLVYVSDGVLLVSDLRGIEVSPGVRVHGEVGLAVNLSASDMRSASPRHIDDAGTTWTGAALDALVAEAVPDAGANATEVVARDGSTLVVTEEMWLNATIAYSRDGTDLGESDGYLVLVVDTGSGVLRLEGVAQVRVYTEG